MKPLKLLTVSLLLLSFASTVWSQNLFIQGNTLSDRTYNSDNGPTNSQLTLDFTNAQAGVLQNILTWGENSGSGGINGVGQSFEFMVLRPLNSTNYLVVFTNAYVTVGSVGTNIFAVSGAPFGLRVGDVVAHYGRGIAMNIGTGGPSSVYIAANLPTPVLNSTITLPSTTYPLYNDGGRNYAIQVQLMGQPFLVTTNGDNGPGSLRQAVLNANALGGTNTITFTNTLSGQTILLTSGQIEVSNNVTIDASSLANEIVINGNASSRIFQLDGGVAGVLNALIITNGYSSYGGGIYVESSGTLIVTNCTLAKNGSSGDGGGIASRGTLTVNQSTFFGNNTFGGGGGLENDGTMTVKESTFFGNSATGGGGIDQNTGPLLTVSQSTFYGNIGSGILIESGTFNLTNTIVSLNSGGDIGGGVNSSLSNLVGRADINLAPLGKYGGPTLTMPPLPGSPAIDAGAVTTLTTDQRGLPRVAGRAVDIGAVEAGDAIPGYTYGTVVNTNSDFLNGLITNVVSLRNAATFATNNANITFVAGLSGQTILLTNGQIVLNTNLTIDASSLPGGIAINGNHASRHFIVSGGSTVTLNSLTLTNGYDTSGGGGGSIFNSSGSLTLNECALVGNATTYFGGAIRSPSGNTLMVNESTITGNSCTDDGGGIASGGTAVINQCTVSQNTATAPAGGIYYSGGTLTLQNSIIAANNASSIPNINTGFATVGVNLTSGNPLLAPLGNYGGPTPTMPPLTGSPAIDAGGTTTFTTDQRGFPRSVGAAPDIGAVELQSAAAMAPVLKNLTRTASGSTNIIQFAFTNQPAADFTVVVSTNITLPLSQWGVLGRATQSASGQFQFSDAQTNYYAQRFYRVRSP